MKLKCHCVLVVLMVIVGVTKGEYNVQVSEFAQRVRGFCHRMVTVSGNGIKDKVPVRCDTVKFIVATNKVLVVGDKLFSNKDGTLIVLGSKDCERRKYKGGALEAVEPLVEDECVKVKLTMIKTFMVEGVDEDEEDDWSVIVNSESVEGAADSRLNFLNSYTSAELRKWAQDILKS